MRQHEILSGSFLCTHCGMSEFQLPDWPDCELAEVEMKRRMGSIDDLIDDVKKLEASGKRFRLVIPGLPPGEIW